MNATKKLALSLIFLIAASIFTFGALFQKKTPVPVDNPVNEDLVFYYGSTCPHCKTVEDYLALSDPTNKLKIAQKESWDNAANQSEYVKNAKICGIYEGQVTVPMLWNAKTSKCLVGAEPIIEFVRQLLDAQGQQPNK